MKHEKKVRHKPTFVTFFLPSMVTCCVYILSPVFKSCSTNFQWRQWSSSSHQFHCRCSTRTHQYARVTLFCTLLAYIRIHLCGQKPLMIGTHSYISQLLFVLWIKIYLNMCRINKNDDNGSPFFCVAETTENLQQVNKFTLRSLLMVSCLSWKNRVHMWSASWKEQLNKARLSSPTWEAWWVCSSSCVCIEEVWESEDRRMAQG